MKLQVNRISKIRNGGVAIEVPLKRADELPQALQQGFDTRAPKINRPKFKIFDVPADLDKEQFTLTVHEQNLSDKFTIDQLQIQFVPLFRTGPRNETLTQ